MAQSIKEKIWAKLVDRLNGIGYVEQVIEGARQVNLNGKFPCMYVDLEPSDERWESLPKRRQARMAVLISAQIKTGEGRQDKQIVGDDKLVGILRYEEDILKAVEGSDIRYLDSGDPLVHNYAVEIVDYRNVNNEIREVIIRVTFETKIFSAEARA